MFEHVTRPQHFILPGLFVVIGGGLAPIPSLLWAGIGLLVIGAAQTLWLTVVGIVAETRKETLEKEYLMDIFMKLSPDERAVFGFASAPAKVEVVIDKTAVIGGQFNKSYRLLSVKPYVMKAIAQGCLAGRPFSTREWSGTGKLLSDPDFRLLQDELVDMGFIKPRSLTDNRQGYVWTDEGRVMLDAYIHDPLIER